MCLLGKIQGKLVELHKKNQKRAKKEKKNTKFETKLHIFNSWFGLNIKDERTIGINWMKIEVQGLKRNENQPQDNHYIDAGGLN